MKFSPLDALDVIDRLQADIRELKGLLELANKTITTPLLMHCTKCGFLGPAAEHRRGNHEMDARPAPTLSHE